MKRILIILTLAITAMAWQACVPRYTLNGASIDYNVYKTISFGEFPIRAALVYPPLIPPLMRLTRWLRGRRGRSLPEKQRERGRG